MYLTNIIEIYTAKLLAGIEEGGIDDKWFEYCEVQTYADNGVL